MGITINGSGITSSEILDGTLTEADWGGNQLSHRNLIINGAMQVAQRGTSFSNPSGGDYLMDRFQTLRSQASKLDVTQNLGSVTPPQGFSNYLGIDITATATIGASDYFGIRYNLEGYDTSHLNFGSSNAQTVTLSFYVYCSTTGTFGGSLQNYAGNRSYPFDITINTANTWERKTITIAGDTSGTWVGSSNAGAFTLNIMFGVGSNYTGTKEQWNGANDFAPTSSASLMGDASNYFYLTGVQLEVGSVATPFEHRSYGEELARCQRYFYNATFENPNERDFLGMVWVSTVAWVQCDFPVYMRTEPSVSSNFTGSLLANASAYSVSSITAGQFSQGGGTFTANGSGFPSNSPCAVRPNSSHYFYLDAEL